jgi:uroporphyrinogen-III decarboxylase
MAIELGQRYLKQAPGPSAGGLFCSPWSLICQAIGYPRAVRAIMRDKVYGQALFDWAEESILFPFMQAFAKNGVKSAAGPDAWAAYPNLTPELMEEWVVPSVKRFGQRCKKELGMTVYAGTAAGDYCEEDPAKFDKTTMFKCLSVGTRTFPLKVAFSGMGRTQDWNMDWMQEFAMQEGGKGHKLPIMVSLNGRFMRDSKPEVIVGKIREWIDIMGRDGGLVIWIGNVPSDTPPVNVHAAVQAAHKLGRYPIKADLSSIKLGVPSFQPFEEWLKGQPEEDVILKAREWKPGNKKVFA